MRIFITGATGATGRLLTGELLRRGHSVTAVVRTPEKLAHLAQYEGKLTLIEKEITSMKKEEVAVFLKECDAATSCLGHNITFKGLFGPPRRLVTDAARLVCSAFQITEKERTPRFLLMNTTGNRDRRVREKAYKPIDRFVLGFFTLLLPPQTDNVKAALYLQKNFTGKTSPVSWCAVRPDTLIDETEVSPYVIHDSPLRSPVFDAGKTSRINVANFMADLITDEALWDKWSGKMPVIYNEED